MSFKLKVKGDKKVLKELKAVKTRYPEGFKAGLYGAAEVIMADAAQRTPVDTGYLRNSRFIAWTDRVSATLFELGYGAVYAARQHYETSWNHRVGEALFLQRAIDKYRTQLPVMVATFAKAAIKMRKGLQTIPKRLPSRPPKQES